MNARGFTLLDTVVAVVIISLAALGSASVFALATQQVQVEKRLMARERIFESLANIAGLPASLRASCHASAVVETNNDALKACTLGTSGTTCVNRNGDGSYRAFRLYLPQVDNIAASVAGGFDFQTSGAITGTPGAPLRYDVTGGVCDTAVSVCPAERYPLEAFTEFMPICESQAEAAWRTGYGAPDTLPSYPQSLNSLPTCSSARFVKIRLTVRPSVDSGTMVSGAAGGTQVAMITVDAGLVRGARH